MIAAGRQMTKEMWFEDFRVGQRFVSTPRRITQDELETFAQLSGDLASIHTDADYARSVGFAAPLVHGPFGIAVAFGLLHELGIVATTAIAMRGLTWRFIAPVIAGDSLSLELTVTRCRRRPDGRSGLVNRHFRLRNGGGAIVQEGTSGFLIKARDAVGEDGYAVATDFATKRWAVALCPILESEQLFSEATRYFDGTFGLQCGDEAVQLRIYRSKILECTSHALHGPTFTLSGSELAWVELSLCERNEFIAYATSGRFAVSGNSYEYLRMTKAMIALWDAIRTLAASSVS